MDTIENRIKNRMSREIIGLNFFKNVNVNMPNRNEYSQTKREIRFFQVLFDNSICEDDENYKRIKEYIERTENQYPETQRFEEIFDEYDVDKDRDLKLSDYLLRICSKYQGTQTQVFATTFVSGVTFDFKSRERYLKEMLPFLANENILLIHDATFFANYSKGFIVTENMVVDLKSKQKIDFKDITDCNLNSNSVNVIGNGNIYLTLSVANPIIKFYLESIIKCYSSYKGKLLREETERLNQEIDRENKIISHAENSKDSCFENGIKAITENDLSEAELNFIALNRIADSQEDKMLSYAGLALCNLNNRDRFIENISNIIQYQVNKNDSEFKAKINTLINCVTVDGKALLSVIVNEGDIQALTYFLELELDIDFNKTYNNATLLDIAVYSRKLFREKTDKYKEIEDMLQDKGCERKWNVEYNRPYVPTLNIQEIIKQSIFKCIEKSNNEIKVGEDLRRSIPDKCQKAAINLGVRYENPIYLIYDNTTFKSLKNGFAICGDGIYIASEMGEHLFIPWRDILKAQIVFNGGYIFFEGAKLSVNQINAMNLYKLFDDLKYEISEYGEKKSDNEQYKNEDNVLEQQVDINQMQEVTAVPQESEISQESQVQEISEVSGESEISQESQVQEISEVSGESETTQESQVQEISEVPEESGTAQESQVQEISEVSGESEISQESQVQEISEVPDKNVTLQKPQAQENKNTEEIVIKQEVYEAEDVKVPTEVVTESVIEQEVEIQAAEVPTVEIQKSDVQNEQESKSKEEKTQNEQVVCINCGKVLPATAAFCKICGTKIEVKVVEEEKLNEAEEIKIQSVMCPECNTINSETSFFCKRCGFKLK